MPFELIDPILSSRQIRLFGRPDISAVVVLMGPVAGQLRGQLVASLSHRYACFELIFDKTFGVVWVTLWSWRREDNRSDFGKCTRFRGAFRATAGAAHGAAGSSAGVTPVREALLKLRGEGMV